MFHQRRFVCPSRERSRGSSYFFNKTFRNFSTEARRISPGENNSSFFYHIYRDQERISHRAAEYEMGKLLCTTVKAKNGNPLVAAEGPEKVFRDHAKTRPKATVEHRSHLVFSLPFFFFFSPGQAHPSSYSALLLSDTPRIPRKKRDMGPSLGTVEIFRSSPRLPVYILPRENRSRGRLNSIGRMQMRRTSDTLRSSCYLCPLRARCTFTSHAITFAWSSSGLLASRAAPCPLL